MSCLRRGAGPGFPRLALLLLLGIYLATTGNDCGSSAPTSPPTVAPPPAAVLQPPAPGCSDKTLVFHASQMPHGLIGAGDPDIHRDGNQWALLFESTRKIGQGLDIYEARLPAGATLTSNDWSVNPTPLSRRVPGTWDALVIETPNFVRGPNGVQRIYYTGYDAAISLEGHSEVAIGLLELRNGAWERHGDPVIRGTEPYERHNDRSLVAEPAVLYRDGRYHMWYSGGMPPNLIYAASADGIHWGQQRVLVPGERNMFSPHLNDDLILGLASNLQGGPLGGAYTVQLAAVDAFPGFETFKMRVARGDGTWWHAVRALAPSAQLDNGKLVVFFRAEDAEYQLERPHIGRVVCDP